MPFCSKCGNQVADADIFCARCGARQPVGAIPRPKADFLAGLPPRTASILCYVPGIGWIAAIIVLAAEKFRQDRIVRFHAFQGLYLFVAWLVVDWFVRPMMRLIDAPLPVHGILQAVLLGMCIFMMIKASHDQAYALPLFGELAHRSVVEG